MSRKKRARYRVLAPLAPEGVPPSARVLAIVTIIQWALWFFVIGSMLALLLVLSLYTKYKIGFEWWLRVWPTSISLFNARGLDGHQMAHLALRLAGENGLEYAAIGALAGGLWALLRHFLRRIQQSGRA